MFEGAHFCMACGSSMRKSHDPESVAASRPSIPDGPLELDEDWGDVATRYREIMADALIDRRTVEAIDAVRRSA